MSAHTPGPWNVQPWQCHAATSVMADGKQIAECSGLGRHTDDCLDDARLIAAAPELLDALQGLLNVVRIAESGADGKPHQYLQSRSGSMVFSADAVATAIAAIAKAQGVAV